MVVVGFDGPENWAKAHGVKLEFGRFPKKANSPRVKFEFRALKFVVNGCDENQNLVKTPQ
jgi:hypothetical protein